MFAQRAEINVRGDLGQPTAELSRGEPIIAFPYLGWYHNQHPGIGCPDSAGKVIRRELNANAKQRRAAKTRKSA